MIVYAYAADLHSIGGAYSEHAGVVNVGLEGIMVMGQPGNYASDLQACLRKFDTMVVMIVAAGWSLFSLIRSVTIHSVQYISSQVRY